MSVLTIKPSVATLGATVTGAKLNKLSASHWSTIEAASNEHGVLVFPDQHLSTAEQIDFGRRFGEIAIEASYINNLLPDGSVRAPDEAMMKTLRGNEYWHTDSSFMPLAAKVSILSAHQVPDSGGETEWADMRAAYDALDDGTRSRMAGLKAYHSVLHAQSRLGQSAEETARMLAELTARHDDEEDTENDKKPVATYPTEPPLRPLVKVHPATPRPSLFVGRHAYGIPGLTAEESEWLLDDLVEIGCQAPRVFQHRWQPGDIAIWDNRCVLHRARPWNLTEPRVMLHTRVAGDPATELAS
jgi:alpha-ketoglutarate-dependent taurine dioxygenase